MDGGILPRVAVLFVLVLAYARRKRGPAERMSIRLDRVMSRARVKEILRNK